MGLIHYIGEDIIEGGMVTFTLSWYDANDSAVTPNSMSYTVRHADSGKVVNDQLDVAMSALAETNTLTLAGDDLVAGRMNIFFDGLYDSYYGNNQPLRDILKFMVRPFE